MKITAIAAALLAATVLPAAAEGDAEAGEREFNKCKSCHMIESPEGETIVRGGRVGPNLYGVMGRQAGTVEGFRYGESLVAAGEAGLVWDAETLVAYVADPKAFLVEATGDSAARSKMSFRLNKGVEDIAAYLASVGPQG